ncbi:MAG: hypothetical protein U5N86_09065 [Planctomycetota bacterium]|nr:hypothetical protein [Planctomycetota bacterium]
MHKLREAGIVQQYEKQVPFAVQDARYAAHVQAGMAGDDIVDGNGASTGLLREHTFGNHDLQRGSCELSVAKTDSKCSPISGVEEKKQEAALLVSVERMLPCGSRRTNAGFGNPNDLWIRSSIS